MSTPETIYLIPGEYEEGLVWCDDPAPDSYSDPAVAVKYVRADTLPVVTDNGKVNVGLIAENERLQARVAELYDLIKYAQVESGVCMCGDNMQDHNQSSGHSPVDVWDHAVEQVDKGGTSEAFIKRKQAEALCACAEELKMSNRYEDPIFIREMATAHGFITGTAQTLIDEAAKAEGADNA
jgi:hypothetical protein